MKVQLITEKLTEDDKKNVLLSTNNRGTALCNHCLKRIVLVKEAVMENDTMFCSPQCARGFRSDKVVKAKGNIVNNE